MPVRRSPVSVKHGRRAGRRIVLAIAPTGIAVMIGTIAVTPDPIMDLVRRRTRAGWIDVVILFAIGVLISTLAGQSHIGHWTSTTDGVSTQHRGVSVSLNGGLFWAWCGFSLLYYFVAELGTGQTLGKYFMGLKVITISGRPLDA